jgi:hypothetical protein
VVCLSSLSGIYQWETLLTYFMLDDNEDESSIDNDDDVSSDDDLEVHKLDSDVSLCFVCVLHR